jgi:hypothetical protein
VNGPRDQVNHALNQAGSTSGPQSWAEARATVYGGSTRRTAEAAGVSERSVQRWIAAEEGRSSQRRIPRPQRLANLNRRAALQRVADGAPVTYGFSGDIETTGGGHRGRRGRRSTQHRNTGDNVQMDPEAAREWARAELAGEPDAMNRLSEAMFGPDSDYQIPPSPDYPAVARMAQFNLRIG